MNYSNVIGFILIILFVFQVLSGLFPTIYYDCFYTIAFDSVIYIMHDINIGWFIRLYHCLGATLFNFFLLIHWIRGAWIGFRIIETKIHSIWVSGWLILISTLINSFLGYILNWGQMSFWGITVMINILSILPFFGIIISELIWCTFHVIINRIYVAHFIIGFIIILIILLHIFFLHTFSSSIPLLNIASSIFLSLLPIFWKDVFSSLILLSLLVSTFFFFELEIIGNVDNQDNANPLNTPLNILPEWYFLLFYGLLRSIPNKLIGVFIIILFIVHCLVYGYQWFMVTNHWILVTIDQWLPLVYWLLVTID